MSRILLASLTAASAMAAGAALAQSAPVPEAAPPAAAPAPEAAAPAASAPVAPAEAAPAAPPAPALPPIPTEGVGARALQILDTVCLPMIRQPGSDPKTVVKPLNLKKGREDGTWQMKLDGVNRIDVRVPNANNVSTCDLTLNYDVGQGPAVIAALTAWGANQAVALQPDKAAEPYVIDNLKYATTNWVAYSASTRMGLAFTEQKKADGSPAGKNADQATVSLSFRALGAQDRTASQ